MGGVLPDPQAGPSVPLQDRACLATPNSNPLDAPTRAPAVVVASVLAVSVDSCRAGNGCHREWTVPPIAISTIKTPPRELGCHPIVKQGHLRQFEQNGLVKGDC